MLDLEFLAGNFLHGDLSPEKEYLKFYFKKDKERYFISYYVLFSSLYFEEGFTVFFENFCDHTGKCSSRRWIQQLLSKVIKVEKALQKASDDMDLAYFGKIKAGEASFPWAWRENKRKNLEPL